MSKRKGKVVRESNAPKPTPTKPVDPAARAKRNNTILAVSIVVLFAVGVGALVYFMGPGFQGTKTHDGPNPVCIIETSKGVITIELDPGKAPISVENFLKYVDEKHYDGTIFHRVIPTFMIQGGGMTPDMRPKRSQEAKGIHNESFNGLKNDRGTLAMARTDAPHSATDQFFINVRDNGFLDRANAKDGVGYAVFGKVIDGMDVVDAIRVVPTGGNDVPVETVLIKTIRRK